MTAMNAQDRMTVLIVDDEYLIRYSLQKLMEHEGYSAITAGSGREALLQLGSCRPDIVILDVNLPDVNGLALLKTIKENHPSATVIVVTGCPEKQGRIDALGMGALDYLEKPVNLDSLNALMHALQCRGPRTAARIPFRSSLSDDDAKGATQSKIQ